MSDESKRLMKLFDDAKNSRADKRDAVFKELDAFDRGDQWNIRKMTYPTWLPRPVTNFIHYVKTYKTASISVESLIGELRPLSPEDVEPVDEMQKIYEYMWDMLDMKYKIRDVISDSRLFGTGVLQLGWDENKIVGGKGYRAEGEIVAKVIPVTNFFPDPSAFDLDSCRYVVITDRVTKQLLKGNTLFKGKVEDIKVSSKSADERGEVLYRDYDTYQDDVIDMYTFYEKVPNKDGGFGIKVTYVAGGKILHVIEDLKPACYPFVVLREWKQTHDFWGKSSCEIILDNQKLINKIESIIALIGSLSANPPKIVNGSSGIDPKVLAKYGTASGYTFTSNGSPRDAVHVMEPPQIPAQLFNLLAETKGAIKEIAGLNDAYVGNAIGSVQTSSGINSLIERSTIRDKDAMYELEMFIRNLSSLLIKFMTTHYENDRLLRIDNTNPNEEERFRFIKFKGADYKDLDFDFVIDVTTKTEHSKQKEQEEMQKLLQMQMQFQPEVPLLTMEEAIQMSDIASVKKSAILKRMRQEEREVQLEKMKQVLSYAVQAMNTPEAMEQGLTIDGLAESAVQIFQPSAPKTGDVGGVSGAQNQNVVQQRQAGL